MCLVMNGFYCLKRLRGNEPIAFDLSVSYSEPRPTASSPAANELTHIHAWVLQIAFPVLAANLRRAAF